MAMKDFCNAKSNLWPYAIRHAVDWHNCDAGKIGSSANNPEISAYQRFTGKQPKVNDLATFGCRAGSRQGPGGEEASRRAWD